VTSPQAEAPAVAEAAAALTRGAVDVLPAGALERQLAEERPLRVKFGVDPTSPDIHLGHCVVLNKLRAFQELGHTVVLIIGDYTARVGDPSGLDATRPVLDPEQIDRNAGTYVDQALRVLDPERTELRRNGEWLRMESAALFELARRFTVARLLERDDFTRRMQAGEPISTLELLYPVLQGYDSVAVRADVELGATDQTFNLLFARDVQESFGQPPQSILTMPILPGTDGVRKMSKSYDNYVGVAEPPEEMFGKLMSIPDELLPSYYLLLLDEQHDEARHPAEAKRELARRLVERFAGDGAGSRAEESFDRVHVHRELPPEMPSIELGSADGEVHLPSLIARAFGVTTSEARRLLGQGGVRLDGEVLPADPLDLPAGELTGKVLQVGKRRFVRVR